MKGVIRHYPILAVVAWIALVPGTRVGRAQNPAQASQPVNAFKPKCADPANPRRRRFGCKDTEFEWDGTFTGDWKSARSRLKELGFTPTVSYAGMVQTNIAGGSHQAYTYAGQLDAALDINLQKLLHARGLSIYVSTSFGHGSSMDGVINSIFPVNYLYAPHFYLGEMYLQQAFLDGNIKFAGGRLGPGNTFATLPVLGNYMTSGVDPSPASIGTNDISFYGPPPGTEWGLQMTYSITPVIQIDAGIFNNNLNSANGANHGTDFTLQQGNKGALVVGQFSYLFNQGARDKGMQGQYVVGFWNDGNAFATVPNSNLQQNGDSGVYVLGQQMIFRPKGSTASQGLTMWGSWTYSRKEAINPMPVFLGSGLSYTGLFRSRKLDVISAGWIRGRLSKLEMGATATQLIELNYQWKPLPSLTVTPTLQFVLRPNGYKAPGVAIPGLMSTFVL